MINHSVKTKIDILSPTSFIKSKNSSFLLFNISQNDTIIPFCKSSPFFDFGVNLPTIS